MRQGDRLTEALDVAVVMSHLDGAELIRVARYKEGWELRVAIPVGSGGVAHALVFADPAESFIEDEALVGARLVMDGDRIDIGPGWSLYPADLRAIRLLDPVLVEAPADAPDPLTHPQTFHAALGSGKVVWPETSDAGDGLPGILDAFSELAAEPISAPRFVLTVRCDHDQHRKSHHFFVHGFQTLGVERTDEGSWSVSVFNTEDLPDRTLEATSIGGLISDLARPGHSRKVSVRSTYQDPTFGLMVGGIDWTEDADGGLRTDPDQITSAFEMAFQLMDLFPVGVSDR